ncbi:MAG: 2-isopropylmalate synthase [Spirochaetales bacterium]|nr:2-isopropylmalate synthase [Spirochaetales bacterium]
MNNRIYIFDTTLRDGEQSPGASMTTEQKFEIAVQLEQLGVDAIEAGFPVSSPHQFSACKKIAAEVRNTTITALARSVEPDINAAAEALKPAAHPRIHTFIASSPIHMEYKLKMKSDDVLEQAVKGVTYARKFVPEVEFSPEDATRSDLAFLIRLIEKVIDAGATIINIPDTVGYAVPDEFGAFITAIREGVPNMDKALLSVHCHNDLGLGVANSLTAVRRGARQIECTINGIGERAGNAALEEIVMALEVRKDSFGCTTAINTKQIYNTSRLLSNIIAFPIARNKPIVGDNAFAHESGIHQDGMLKHRETYEIMRPDQVGREFSHIVLGRHSGMHGFQKRLSELGIRLTDAEKKNAFDRFLELADRKKEVFDEDLLVISGEVLGRQTATYNLEYFNILSGNVSVPTATIRLKINDETREEAATGDGPVDAIFRAIDRVTEIPTTLLEYNVLAVTPGKQALGEVSVILRIHDATYLGKGSSTDILEASARAYVNALNRYKLTETSAGCPESL